MRHLLTASVLILLLVLVAPAVTRAVSGAAPNADSPIAAMTDDEKTLNLQSRLGEIQLVREGDQLLIYHNGHTLSPDQYFKLIDAQQHRRDAGGPLFTLFNITTLAGVIWVAMGLLGQLLFTGRMLVQWVVSEKEKRSVVPPIFWHMSLAGASMLLAYFIWRKDIVGVLGQATGWGIYARNVYLIRKSRITATRTAEARAPASGNAPQPS